MLSFFDKTKHQEKHEKHVNFSSQELGATISYSRKKNAEIRESYMTRLPAIKYPISLTHDAVNRASVERPASPAGLNRVHQFSGLQKIPEIPVPIVKLEPIGRIKKTTSANTPRKEPAPEPKSSKCVIM